MSSTQLENILNDAIKVIETDLRNELNLGVNVATFTPWVLKDAIIKQLQFTHIKTVKDKEGNEIGTKRKAKFQAWKALTKDQKKQVKDIIEERTLDVMQDLLTSYKNFSYDGVDFDVQGTAEKFTVTAVVLDPSKLKTINTKKGEIVIGSAFAGIRSGYREIMNDLWAEIGQMVQELSGIEEKAKFKKGAFALEHRVGSSIAERRVSAGVSELYGQLKKELGSETKVKQFMRTLGLGAYIKFISTDDLTQAELFIGALSKNARQGQKFEKGLIEGIKGPLLAAAERAAKGVAIEGWSGSDDRVTIEKKKIVEAFNDSLKVKNKKSINTKRNLSQQTTRTKKIKAKTKVTREKLKPLSLLTNDKTLKTPQKARTTNSADSLITLKALLNAKLPAEVRKNMKSPALVNRTGRFAGSVRVEEVTETAQGFPSIGYSYRKNPYQTFEPGGKLGSDQRDPRKLIDKSIRELAAEIVVGRFYTRRV